MANPCSNSETFAQGVKCWLLYLETIRKVGGGGKELLQSFIERLDNEDITPDTAFELAQKLKDVGEPAAALQISQITLATLSSAEIANYPLAVADNLRLQSAFLQSRKMEMELEAQQVLNLALLLNPHQQAN